MRRNAAANAVLPAVILAIALTACSSTPAMRSTGPAATTSLPANSPTRMLRELYTGVSVSGTGTRQEQEAVLLPAAFRETMNECRKVLSTLEGKADRYRDNSFYLAVAGTIAGAVIAPALTAANAAANKAWIASMSGFAGATNTMQSAMRDLGLTGTAALEIREAARKQMVEATTKFSEGILQGDASKQRAALVDLTSACDLFAITVPPQAVANTPVPSTGTGARTPD